MKRFTRTIENFTCTHCGHEVEGNGYTNHCPKCLWSRHVDISPGDRANPCKGMLKPVAVKVQGGNYKIIHRCSRCDAQTSVKSVPNDDFDALLAVMRGQAR